MTRFKFRYRQMGTQGHTVVAAFCAGSTGLSAWHKCGTLVMLRDEWLDFMYALKAGNFADCEFEEEAADVGDQAGGAAAGPDRGAQA